MRLGLLNREQLSGPLAETFDAFIGQIQESWETEHALNGRHTGVNASEYVAVGTRLLLKGYTTELSPGLSQMNSDQWSIDPTRVSVVRLQPGGNLAITGIPIFDEFTRGQILLFLNVSAFAVTFKYENSGSPETHRLYTPDQLDMLVPRTGGAVLAWYDTDNLRWRVLPFQAGVVSGSNTGDQLIFQKVAVSGQSDIVADTTADTLTVASGRTAIVLTTSAGSDTLTISVSDFVGDSGSGGVAGLVPAPAAGDATKFLKGNGTWASGGGGNISSTGAAGSEPGSPASGDLYLPNNAFNIERYSGSAWVGWGPIFPLTDPNLAGLTTWINQGAASKVTTCGITILDPVVAGTQERMLVKTAPSTPYTITALVLLSALGNAGAPHAGICFRESGSGKVHYCALQDDSSSTVLIGRIYSAKMTSPTVFSATYQSYPFDVAVPIWLRITDDGTNRKCFVSRDGVNFIQFHSVGRTDFITADQVGVIVGNSSTFDIAGTLLSWKET